LRKYLKVWQMKKRIVAGTLLALLIVVPFLDWRIGAVLWMSAWLVFILQKLSSREDWNLGKDGDDGPNKDNSEE
jgi:hypothetical protein